MQGVYTTLSQDRGKCPSVVCLTPERRKTKLYKTTDKGVQILSKIDEITGGN